MRTEPDQLHPWQAFPRLQPTQFGARQGAEELWFEQVWKPFWAFLGPEERARYHERWQTSAAWREAIDFFGQPPPTAEALAADAAESEAWLRDRARAAEAPPDAGLANRLARWWRRRSE